MGLYRCPFILPLMSSVLITFLDVIDESVADDMVEVQDRNDNIKIEVNETDSSKEFDSEHVDAINISSESKDLDIENDVKKRIRTDKESRVTYAIARKDRGLMSRQLASHLFDDPEVRLS